VHDLRSPRTQLGLLAKLKDIKEQLDSSASSGDSNREGVAGTEEETKEKEEEDWQ